MSSHPNPNSTTHMITKTPENKNNKNNKTPLKQQQKQEQEQPPYAETDLYDQNPPIPLFNYIIDPHTFEILEDRTGQP